MTRHDCADCGERRASVFLPEGRYLCSPCWTKLRELRQSIHHQTAERSRKRAEGRKSR